ncbi:phosphate-starvation-inducible PsiE family protein [Betaproteobacteria bacterium SCN2]|jgi:protein PsiE|nr:phosphate-starvation-inducible PsiE family protein [Betaproteobacteria bacterium SCN2]
MPADLIRRFNQNVLALVEHLGLGVIAVATVVAAAGEVKLMFDAGAVTLPDLLLLFLYLEVLAMVSVYYRQGKLPIRFPLYIGMIALARYLIIDMKNISELRMLVVAGAILLLAFAVLVVRYGHIRLPYPEDHNRE